jgi:hypothetical protein
MLNALPTRLEYPYVTTAKQPAAIASEGRSFAVGAARQRETDLIMEALVREYMTVRNIET